MDCHLLFGRYLKSIAAGHDASERVAAVLNGLFNGSRKCLWVSELTL